MGTATPIVSATTISSGPAAATSAASSTTRAGSTRPSNGHPKAVEIVTFERNPSSRARATIRSAAATESATEEPWLRSLNVSLAAKAKCTSSRPVASSRS